MKTLLYYRHFVILCANCTRTVMVANLERKVLLTALRLVLKPIVQFCFHHSIKIQELVELAKAAFIDVARAELDRRGERSTDSRLSVMTGLHRRDVVRLSEDELKLDRPIDLITKVIGQWQQDTRFVTKDGVPRVLSAGSEDSEFTALVRSVSRELNPATLLRELERVGAVEWGRGRNLKLVVQAYTPKGDLQAGFRILSEDMSDLLAAAEENIVMGPEIPNLHSRTAYDRVRAEALPEIRRWLLKEGHLLHEKARAFISQYDQDINPSPSFRGRVSRVSVCTFSQTLSHRKGSE